MMKRKSILAVILAGTMMLGIAGCSGGGTTEQTDSTDTAETTAETDNTETAESSETSETSSDDIVIGVSASITGSVPINGQNMRQGVELAVKEINANGGVLGRQLSIVVEDDQNTQTGAVNVANRLLSEGVCAVIGPHSSGNASATSDTYENGKMPYMTGGSSPALEELGNPYMFRVRPSDSINGEVMVRFAIENLGATKVGISYNNNDFGTGGRDVVQAALDEAGIEYVSVGHNAGDRDLTGQLMQLQSEGVDCIISYTDDAEVALTARQIYELGLDVPVIASAGIVTQQVLDLVEPEYVEGWYAVTDFISTNDSTEVAEFVKNYQDAYGTEPEIFASSYYSATYVLADAIERAGSDDPEAIRAALMETEDLVLPEGTYTCDEGGAMVHGCVVAQIQDKVPVMIDYVTAE